MDLEGKIVLVTGASKGIGKDLCTSLSSQGATVAMAARTKKLLDDLKAEIEGKGGKAHCIEADLSRDEHILSMFKIVRERFGRLDVLINNAGIGIFGSMVDFSMQDFDKIMQINLRAVFLCCQQALKMMIKEKNGHIINMSSAACLKGYANQTAYTASKQAIIGLTRSLAAEAQEHNISVSVILPGGVDTDMISIARPDLDKSVLIPPSDISKTVIYMLGLSDRSMVDEIFIRRRAKPV